MLRIHRQTQTDGQTDYLNNGTLYAPQYEEAFLPIDKNGPGRFALSALPQYKYMHTMYENRTSPTPRTTENARPPPAVVFHVRELSSRNDHACI